MPFSIPLVVHVTPVQRVQLDEQVLLECNMTSVDTNEVLSGLRLAWYDGFIPLSPAIENITNLKHQIVVNILVSSWLQYGRYVCKVESETGTLVKKTAILPPGSYNNNVIDLTAYQAMIPMLVSMLTMHGSIF